MLSHSNVSTGVTGCLGSSWVDGAGKHSSTKRKTCFQDTLPGEHPSGVQPFREGQTVPTEQLQSLFWRRDGWGEGSGRWFLIYYICMPWRSRFCYYQVTIKISPRIKKKLPLGFPCWLSGKESACQCRRSGFNPWSGKIPQALEQQSPRATTAAHVL